MSAHEILPDLAEFEELRELPEEFRNKLASVREQARQTEASCRVSTGAPFIGENTYLKLRDLFFLDIGNRSRRIVSDLTDTNVRGPYNRGLDIANSYLEYLSCGADRNGTFYQIGAWLDKVYQAHPQSPMLKDAAAVGMGIVLSAFHIELSTANLERGGKFMGNLRIAQPGEMMRILDSQNTHFIERVSIIDRIRHSMNIPEHQVYLGAFLTEFIIDHAPIESAVEDGAAAMYSVIDKLWPSLAPVTEQSMGS
ncbi:hypothetical protein HYS93_04140 [Candidatus Daviesbacteria bacterium]|nr:hypothetical protein [Candidatus Daviesbacteria bacterium]